MYSAHTIIPIWKNAQNKNKSNRVFGIPYHTANMSRNLNLLSSEVSEANPKKLLRNWIFNALDERGLPQRGRKSFPLRWGGTQLLKRGKKPPLIWVKIENYNEKDIKNNAKGTISYPLIGGLGKRKHDRVKVLVCSGE